MITALIFVIFNCISYLMALVRGPFWGLFAYLNIYFNAPVEYLNWWAEYIPFDRWSLLSTAVLVASLVIHRDKLSDHKFGNAKWVFWFFFLSGIITVNSDLNSQVTNQYLYYLLTYCVIVFVLIKSLKSPEQLRIFLLSIIVFGAILSVGAYFNGERINSRLEFAGAADAFGSNQFSLLLAAIIPMLVPFIKNGRPYERMICIGSLPFILNAFILCNSRGSTVALIAAVMVATFAMADKKMRRNMAAVILISIPVVVYLADEEFISRFSSLVNFESAMKDEDVAKDLSSGRTEIWLYGMQMLKDYPLGTGPNGFKELSRFYMPEEVLTDRAGGGYGTRAAHNTYLQVLVEQGVFGFIVWIVMGISTSIVLYKSFKLLSKNKPKDLFLNNMAFALNISFLSVLIGGMVNSRVYYEFFWWQIAIAAVLFSLSNKYEAGDRNVYVRGQTAGHD